MLEMSSMLRLNDCLDPACWRSFGPRIACIHFEELGFSKLLAWTLECRPPSSQGREIATKELIGIFKLL